MTPVTKKEFDDITYNIPVSSTETYKNGHYTEHYSIGRGKHYRLIACKYVRGDEIVYKVW